MKRVHVSKCRVVDNNWVVYSNDDGMDKYIDLSACANNFSLNAGKDALSGRNCVGWQYQEGDMLFFELFNIGHLLIYTSVKPTLFDRIFSRENSESKSMRLFREFKEQLNQIGWFFVDKTA